MQPEPMNQPVQKSIPHFFFFINSGSGGGVAGQILNQSVEELRFNFEDKGYARIQCNVHFYNLRTNKDQGFQTLKKMVSSGEKCYAIVCGGDGSVMWVVSEMVKNEIPAISVPIGIIPLGTGNDFSQSLSWGKTKSTLIDKNYKTLKKMIRRWLVAKQEDFDIWDMEAEAFQDGKFERVEGHENATLPGKKFQKTFCNYFSFGIDGKIGYSFDKHRTDSRFGNFTMYAVLGVGKTLTKTPTIDELVERIQIPKEQFKMQSPSEIMNADIIEKSNCQEIQFKNGYTDMVALNINSFTGGVKNIWSNAHEGFVKNQDEVSKNVTPVSSNDGKIQFVTFHTSVNIAVERVFHGCARKVVQTSGPISFIFKRYQNQQKHRTYLQTDGEFIRFTNPKRVTVKLSTLVPNGKIRVLRRNQAFD